MLKRLGGGESIDSLCRAANWTRGEFDAWWQREAASRAPQAQGLNRAPVRAETTIHRDAKGIPHIVAQNEDDLWLAFGYAMAQDRLFQMDYLRRKGLGRLAEVLGPEGVPLDLIARTVGLNRIAHEELTRLPTATRGVLDAFTAGVNAWLADCPRLPIEFDLLDYRPEPWSPVDCLAIENEFRWYLTGRFPVIVMPELAERRLGESPLYRELILGEADDECIIPPEAYANLKRDLAGELWQALPGRPREDVGQAMGDPEGTGSNNWVVAGRFTKSGLPMVASDPHIAFEAVSCWYQAHLCGGGFNVAGMAYVGMPAIMFGRNERVAWGITNNICSLRDLYQERVDPAHPGCFLFDGGWEPAREVTETIAVKGAASQARTIRYSRNGPIVDEILPPPADRTGPVSLKWLGMYHGGWLTSLLQMDRAASVAEFREALRPWHVPTFNLVIADVEGHIAVQSAGRIPLRRTPERGYRAGWDPAQQWMGLLPFEAMPHAIDPSRGWLATANNRVAADDYPYPQYGCWASGYRARRIRQMLEAGMTQRFSRDDFRRMHCDTLSLRAVERLPPMIRALAASNDPRVAEALGHLRAWDGRVEPDLVAPTLFNVFHAHWSRAVAAVYFEGPALDLVWKLAEGTAGRLLTEDAHGWFPAGQREAALLRAFQQTLDDLTQRMGPEISQWQWGRLHRLPLKHVLTARGDLAQLLDHGGAGVSGDMITVCNTGGGPQWLANSGAGYRLVADLAVPGLWAIDAQSQSGHAGTPHYSDQFDAWAAGEYHYLPLAADEAAAPCSQRLVLSPASS